MKKFFLETERLLFSTWQENDEKYALSLWGNPNVSRFITATGIITDEQVLLKLHEEIERFEKCNVQYWPVFLKDDENTFVGCCGLRPYDNNKNILEFGIHLCEMHWGKGYAQEASKAVISYAFNVLCVESLFAGHNPQNLVSASMLGKLGFSYTHDEYYEPTGLEHPSYLLTKENYMKSNND